MIRVRHLTISDMSHKGLLERIETVVESLRNRGDRIIAIMPTPMPFRETEWIATIFHEYEKE